ncbi:hypothetical protein HNQ77_000093 [Silvibacterium bohemicum]|uniref:DUF4440 domain-containing protein n=2 Tax=Silvibacterium bohemicum TaxID=1577686 RepID=A0A841JP00_9BACT|nr:hypothetical protein [Silvibacterium bohemicum]
MKMKFVSVAFTILSFVGPLHAEDVKKVILANETASWQAWVGTRIDIPAAQKLLAPGYVDIDASGVAWSADEMFAQMKNCGISYFKFKDPQVHLLTPNSAAIVYGVDATAMCGDQKISADLLASSVWVKRNGKWLTEIHTETPAKQK